MTNKRSYIQKLLGINDEIEAKLKEAQKSDMTINNSIQDNSLELKDSSNQSAQIRLSSSSDRVKMRLFLRKETRDRLHIHKINSGENISDIVDAAVTVYLDRLS